jgi:hypothetical protein
MDRTSKLIERIHVDRKQREKRYKIMMRICNIGIIVSLGWSISSVVVKYMN